MRTTVAELLVSLPPVSAVDRTCPKLIWLSGFWLRVDQRDEGVSTAPVFRWQRESAAQGYRSQYFTCGLVCSEVVGVGHTLISEKRSQGG
jgi:hypothetical protein